MRDPIVLARYSKFDDRFVDDVVLIQHKNNFIDVQISDNKPEGAWLSFTASLKLDTGITSTNDAPSRIYFCDFSSSGNTWDKNSRYKVWIPEPLNVMKTKYEAY